MVAIAAFDGVVEKPSGCQLVSGRQKTFLCIEEAGGTLTCSAVLAQTRQAALVATALTSAGRLELKVLGHAGQGDILARKEKFC